MKLYRICTEDKNREAVEELLNAYFDGFALFESTGYWKGKKERALTVEIFNATLSNVQYIAETIKAMNAQEAVLVEELEVRGLFV